MGSPEQGGGIQQERGGENKPFSSFMRQYLKNGKKGKSKVTITD